MKMTSSTTLICLSLLLATYFGASEGMYGFSPQQAPGGFFGYASSYPPFQQNQFQYQPAAAPQPPPPWGQQYSCNNRAECYDQNLWAQQVATLGLSLQQFQQIVSSIVENIKQQYGLAPTPSTNYYNPGYRY
ncbi:uncharacterized protein LOC142326848 [Lycorma delicatula]|uniref:uncharacterized protein LOC142326848 n=1 Tax=Lycorma delicatula TaxID=130591 RepID=UPI003F5184D5